LPQNHVEEYSKANIASTRRLISAVGNRRCLVDMTNDILLHVRGYRQLTIGRTERIAASLPSNLGIIAALEGAQHEHAEKLARGPYAEPCRLCRGARQGTVQLTPLFVWTTRLATQGDPFVAEKKNDQGDPRPC